MGSENSSDPHERIKQLEKLVEDQEEQIDELRGRVENQQSNLAHRMQVIEKLQRERDELRKQNADLVAKVAQLSRRQSVTAGSSSPSTNRSRTSPPQLPRRSTVSRPPSLPPTPGSPSDLNSKQEKFQFSPQQSTTSLKENQREPESDTDYSDMEDENDKQKMNHVQGTGTVYVVCEAKKTEGDSKAVNSHPQRRSGVSVVTANKGNRPPPIVDVTALRNRNSSVSSSGSTPPGRARSGSQSGSSDTHSSSSPERKMKFGSQQKRPTGSAGIAKTIREKLNSLSDLGQVSPSLSPQSPQQQLQKQLPQQQLPQQPPQPPLQSPQRLPQSPQQPLPQQLSQPPQQPSQSQQQSPQQPPQQSPQQSLPQQPPQQSPPQLLPPQPLQKLFSQKPQQLSRKQKKTIQKLEKKQQQEKKQQEKEKKQQEKKLLASSGGRGKEVPLNSPHGRYRSLDSPKLTRQTRMGEQSSSLEESQVKSQLVRMESAPVTIPATSNAASGSALGDSSTDFESSFEVISPPNSPPKIEPSHNGGLPLKSALKKPTTAIVEGDKVRKAVSLADVKDKSQSISQDSYGLITVDEEEEEEDELGDMRDLKSSIRSRTQTISALQGGRKPVELGRRRRKDVKTEAARILKRRNSLTHFRRGQRIILKELELISPDVEAKIREKICKAIGNKFGGLQKATQAAITIQRAYRQYKLKKRFDEIRKEASQMRRRAISMSNTRRRPSMLRRQRYRREMSITSANDPLLRTKQAALNVTRERSSYTSSRLHLVQQKRNEHSLSKLEEERAASPLVALETSTCTITVQDESEPQKARTHLDGQEASTGNKVPLKEEAVDGPADLPSSFSTDHLLTAGGYNRPTSCFSVESTSSMQEEIPEFVASTLPRVKPKSRPRTFTKVMAQRRTNIGVNHFNRKPRRGIEYLISQTLIDDEPKSVAKFLMEHGGLSKEKIGEYLGEINAEFNMDVLEALVELIDLGDKPIDEALRQFQQIFRMPGEAQKIDKIMQVFALEYFKQETGGLIKSEDGAYMLSFAIMMLHTSLHNPSVRHRTTKKQWVSMNRGCNDGEDFSETMLLDIYDRIQKNEFTPGQDHTKEVAQIERQILGSTIPRLAIPQRKFIGRVMVSEVGGDLSSRPSFKNRHRRTLLIFSDLVIVCKNRKHNEYQYRDSFSLLNTVAVKFESPYYKNGVQIHSSLENKLLIQCNCDTKEERESLLRQLEETIAELKEMEQERIAELDTTLGKPGAEEKARHRLTSGAGDLLSTAKLSIHNLEPDSKGGRDLVRDAGDLTQGTPHRSSAISKGSEQTNRASGDSGFDSQQPTPSPSPTEQSTQLQSSTPPPTLSTNTTPSHATLAPPSTPPPRSRSSDTIRSLTVTSYSPHNSPSEENLHRRLSASAIEKKAKRGDSKSKRFNFPSPFRTRSTKFQSGEEKLSDLRANSSSPPTQRKTRGSFDSSKNQHSTSSGDVTISPYT